jgi:hypothetical protein
MSDWCLFPETLGCDPHQPSWHYSELKHLVRVEEVANSNPAGSNQNLEIATCTIRSWGIAYLWASSVEICVLHKIY